MTKEQVRARARTYIYAILLCQVAILQQFYALMRFGNVTYKKIV